jgi:uncharacterized membrane protein YeaQ/YmgE (transglycosylase-associated protein family)
LERKILVILPHVLQIQIEIETKTENPNFSIISVSHASKTCIVSQKSAALSLVFSLVMGNPNSQNFHPQFSLKNFDQKYMCMVGYTFLHGCKVFKKIKPSDPFSYKIVTLALSCTGGGIIVPIILNTIPVTLSIDAYPIAIMVSYLVHTYFPILREVIELSVIFKMVVIFFYETTRAYVVTLFTGLAASTISASQFSFPVFGPIVCGTIGGFGGQFLPFTKGLSPIESSGLPAPAYSAFIGATFFHAITQMAASGSIDLVDAPKKAKVIVALWFTVYAYVKAGILPNPFKLSFIPKVGAGKSEKMD